MGSTEITANIYCKYYQYQESFVIFSIFTVIYETLFNLKMLKTDKKIEERGDFYYDEFFRIIFSANPEIRDWKHC